MNIRDGVRIWTENQLTLSLWTQSQDPVRELISPQSVQLHSSFANSSYLFTKTPTSPSKQGVRKTDTVQWKWIAVTSQDTGSMSGAECPPRSRAGWWVSSERALGDFCQWGSDPKSVCEVTTYSFQDTLVLSDRKSPNALFSIWAKPSDCSGMSPMATLPSPKVGWLFRGYLGVSDVITLHFC